MQESTCVDSLNVKVQGEDFLLLSDKAIYWKKERALLIADLHIGKVTHFRNNNIPIPQKAAQQNFDVMERLFIEHKPIKVLFLGDLFHSYYNKEWELLVFSLAKFPKIKFELITGNHDILQAEHYVAAGITCVREMVIGKFILTHHPEEHAGLYNLCGHIHPGARMKGTGRQYIKLPCFYFGEHQGILPAFGSFTGTAALKIKSKDQVFGIVNGQVMKLNNAG